MAIAGTIESSSAITLHRVLERIFDHEQPGRLRLKHKESGQTAEVKIDRGAVQDTVFGDLKGEDALKEITQTFPWDYEFVSEDPSINTGRLPIQPANRPPKRPALKLAGESKPMMLHTGEINAGFSTQLPPQVSLAGARPERKSAFMAEKPAGQQRKTPVEPVRNERPEVRATAPAGDKAGPAPPAPKHRVKALPHAADLAKWVADGDAYAVRFARSGDTAFGKVADSEWEYYHADSASLMLWAAGIGDTLGYSAPILTALVEPQRAASYRKLEDGFAGIYSGPDTTVDMIIGIP